MIKRTLHFGNPAYLSLKDKQLQIELPLLKAEGGSDYRRCIPVEDIGVLVLEHPQITLTAGCTAALLENNVAVISCDSRRMPIGLHLPLESNMVQSERFRYQIDASQPLKKNLWQQTIQAKILNQAAVLHRQGKEIDNMLYWAKSVRSGDPDNYEARAAAYYWQNIFAPHFDFFRNRAGDPPNNLLNYGYAILRAVVARSLVASGLLPTLGIHHRNKYNAYCLADDIMEPYRPYLDLIVIEMIAEFPDLSELSPNMKAKLLSIATVDVHFDNATSPLMVGVQRSTASLAKCFEGMQRKIAYPQLLTNINTILYDKDKQEDSESEEIDLPF